MAIQELAEHINAMVNSDSKQLSTIVDNSNSLLTKSTRYLALFLAFTALVIFYFSSRLLREISLRDEAKKKLETLSYQLTEDVAERSRRLDIALKSSNQAWFDLNPQTGVVSVSEQYPLFLGFELSEFAPSFRLWKKHIHNKDRKLVFRKLQKGLKQDNVFEAEYRAGTKSNGWRWIRSIGNVIERDEDGNATRLIGIHTDITQRKHSEDVLRTLAESNTLQDDDVIRDIVRLIAQSHDVQYVFIARINHKDSNMADIQAIWADGQYMDNFSYSLKGTPCQKVIQAGTCFYPNKIQELFPEDHLLSEMNAESYFGIPLQNAQHKVIGLLAMLDDKPMTKGSEMIELFQSLAIRAGIEIERREFLEKLELTSQVFNDAHDGITITNSDAIIIDVNPAFCNITGYSREEVIGQNPRI